MQIPKLTYRIQSLITAPEINIDLLWVLSAFFIFLGMVYFVSVFFFRNRISSKSALIKQRKTELSPMISEFLFYEDDGDKSEKSNYIGLKIEIRELIRDDFNRQLLTQILLDLRKDVSGDTQKNLFKLYEDLSLEKDAFQKLESWRWEVISKGILELTLMHVEEAYTFIVKFINDRRGTIRKQAEIATVTLKPMGINYFLDTTKYRISEWQQLKLLDVLRNKEDFNPPRFKAWLTSTNKHVVLFALRLIKYYNQNDASAALIELVKHKNQQVRQEAIACIKEFYIIAALPTLKSVFWKSTVDTKIAVLGTLGELGSAVDIEFLRKVSQSEGNFSVKSKAVGAINSIAPESILPTENIEHISAYQNPETLTVVPTPNTIQVPEKKPIAAEPSYTDAANPDKKSQPPEPERDEANDPPVEFTSTIIKKPNPEKELPNINDPMANAKQPDKILRDIEVDAEEVQGTPPNTTTGSEVSHFDIADIHFLPKVTVEESGSKQPDACQNEENDENEDSVEDLVAMEVESDVLAPEPMEEELQALINEINELDFLPVVVPEESAKENEVSEADNNRPSESIEDFEGYSLSDFEIAFDEKTDAFVPTEEEVVAFDLDDKPIIDVENPMVEDVMSWLMAENELREIECQYDTVASASDAEISSDLIPEPVYYDEHEAYMMTLLDDLEELGDIREIPLLEELKAEESKSFIKDRISAMITKFANQQHIKKAPVISADEQVELPVFSVFADLFKNIDTDCKLILLDEIVPVGDEKEIEFLDNLLEDPNQRIRNKAQSVLKLLIAKLSHENPASLQSKGVSAVVAEQIANDNISEAASYGHLLSEMKLAPAVNPEIFNIDFELSEVLDKNYEQKILDIPVIATEVTPNEYGGSFFNSLRKFTKFFF